MLMDSEIVSKLLKYKGITLNEFGEKLNVDKSTVSRSITNTKKPILDKYKEIVRYILYKDYNIPGELFNFYIENEEELFNIYETLIDENKDFSIMNILTGEWYMYAHKSDCKELTPKTIIEYNLVIRFNGSFYLDRSSKDIDSFEEGQMIINNNAIVMYCLNKEPKNDSFISIHIDKINKDYFLGLVAGKNLGRQLFHAGLFICTKERQSKKRIIEILENRETSHERYNTKIKSTLFTY